MSGPGLRSAVIVLGAGFGGLAVAHRLAEMGIDDVAILERDDGVGGTWRANRYPGAACDVPSHLYSLSFAPNPHWSRAYASQPEILAYIEDCYDRFDVRRKVRLHTEVVSATWDDGGSTWRLRDRAGDTYEAPVLVSAIGMFHTPKVPAIAGLDEFAGTVFHSARWDRDHDLAGERVAVIGTGASAIQIVPTIAEEVAHLDLYQRNAPWILPRRDPPYSDIQRREFAERPEVAAEHRQELHDLLEGSTFFLTGDALAAGMADYAGQYLAESVADPELRAKLTPQHPMGCTRPLISSDYYPAVQRPDVDLVTTGIDRITADGIRTTDGVERPADTIVLCTGFHATEYLRGIEVVGRGGVEIHERWAGVPRAYHGITVPGFPNFFMLYGPNTNQGGNSILLMLEAQAQFVASALAALDEQGAATVEVTEDAMARYTTDLLADLERTIWTQGCTTYFHTASGDVVTQLPQKAGWYRERTESLQRDDFTFGGVTCTTS
jgi:cation diffusion facilitator CzcD-associated flavoprotein CzcO